MSFSFCFLKHSSTWLWFFITTLNGFWITSCVYQLWHWAILSAHQVVCTVAIKLIGLGNIKERTFLPRCFIIFWIAEMDEQYSVTLVHSIRVSTTQKLRRYIKRYYNSKIMWIKEIKNQTTACAKQASQTTRTRKKIYFVYNEVVILKYDCIKLYSCTFRAF